MKLVEQLKEERELLRSTTSVSGIHILIYAGCLLWITRTYSYLRTSVNNFLVPWGKSQQSFTSFIFRGEEREKERERNIAVWERYPLAASRTRPAGDLAHNPGMYPNQESNQWHLGSRVGTQSTEPYQLGLK